MSNSGSKKHSIDVIAIIIATFALLVSLWAVNEAKSQNTIAATSAQIMLCSSLADATIAAPGSNDKSKARTKAQELSTCFTNLSEYGNDSFKACVKKANDMNRKDYWREGQVGYSVC